MKVASFYLSLILGAAALGLSLLLLSLGRSNQELQAKLVAQQRQIQRGNVSLKVTREMVGDIGKLSFQYPSMRALLEKNGMKVQLRQPAQQPKEQAAASTEAPATAPEAAEATPEPTPKASPTPRKTRSSR